jgi:peptidoglycan/LPS O-acetylase OafA/YrhL
MWLDGRSAVVIFYIISGFLITLTIHTNYVDTPREFYLNRFIRLFLPLWSIIVPVWVLLSLSGHFSLSPFREVNIYTLISTLSVVGQDLGFLFAVSKEGAIVWQPVGHSGSATLLAMYSPDSPLFSIALEIYFYVLAPFVVVSFRRTIILTSMGALFFLYLLLSHNNAVWLWYHLPISTWLYFGSGSLAWHLVNGEPKKRTCIYVLFSAISCLALAFPIGSAVVYLVVVAGLPSLAAMSRANMLDRYIGDLSYPLYVVHFPVLLLTQGRPFLVNSFWTTLTISVLVALVVHHLVEIPTARLRNRVRSKAKHLSNLYKSCQDPSVEAVCGR